MGRGIVTDRRVVRALLLVCALAGIACASSKGSQQPQVVRNFSDAGPGEYLIRNYSSCWFHVSVVENRKTVRSEVLMPSERRVIRIGDGQRIAAGVTNAPGDRTPQTDRSCWETGTVRVERVRT